MKIQNELKTRFKVALLTLDGWTGLISQIVIDDTDKHWRSQSLNEVKKSRSNSEVEIIAIASYSSQLQLSPGSEIVVGPSVRKQKLWYFPSFDFSETRSEVRGQ